MKTQLKLTPKKVINTLGFVTVLMITTLMFNPVYGQTEEANSTEVQQNERIVKGIITNDEGPVESASITLKGSKVGTVSNSKGEFTFPQALKTGDVLLINYLGYETIAVKIKDDTTFIRPVLSEDLIEFVGALNSNKPYKSKRSN
ncbi:carboxypeptidase-like regulatory domain-containing protein [Hwangdonia lutea]|uniref:Carboxypeptidase-like regulatory domain-containing protein n=1 Tax=Hwangdonia lutea TaxID=3075823 RepID=A0AA97HRX2_9FLAO|nr:carboxypeptidase-like regulatory domain-containing protein [Hwangdonia sp. SCSIO 19198]WOD44308.1 carboxypeptidase-like regulatory domain-containing protein [Hwangdonia sp. SCSIO 19198]